MDRESQRLLNEATKQFQNGKITQAQLDRIVNTVLGMGDEPPPEDLEMAEIWERGKK
jgi:hypothetical protein